MIKKLFKNSLYIVIALQTFLIYKLYNNYFETKKYIIKTYIWLFNIFNNINKGLYSSFLELKDHFISVDNIFTNRQKAIVFWVIFILIAMLREEKVRKSLQKVFKIFFEKKLLILWIMAITYNILIICMLGILKIWRVIYIKETVLWLFFVGFIMIFNAMEKAKENRYFFSIIVQNLKVTIIFKFLTNLYSFNFLTEMLLVPLIVAILVITVITDSESSKNDYKNMANFFNIIMVLIGFGIVINSISQLILNYSEINLNELFIRMSIGNLLSILFIPFLLLVVVISSYESIFGELNFQKTISQKIRKYLYFRIILTCKLNVSKIKNFIYDSNIKNKYINTRNDVKAFFAGYKIYQKKRSQQSFKAAIKGITTNHPHYDLIVSEIRKGDISESDIELYLFIEDKYDYYSNYDEKYMESIYTKEIFKEAQKKFDLSKVEVEKKYNTVGQIMLGMQPQKEIKLDEKSKPVIISIDKIEISPQNELIITATNLTDLNEALPTVNMTFQLYREDKKVGFQVVWAENFKKGTFIFKSSPIFNTFDIVDCVAYINIDKMCISKLKSTVVESNRKGETVIPVYTMNKIAIHSYKENK